MVERDTSPASCGIEAALHDIEEDEPGRRCPRVVVEDACRPAEQVRQREEHMEVVEEGPCVHKVRTTHPMLKCCRGIQKRSISKKEQSTKDKEEPRRK